MILTEFDPNRQVFAGVDLSSTTDMTSFAMVQRTENLGWICNWRYWLPGGDIENAENRDDVPYRQWAADGFLQLTPTTRIDQQAVLQLMVADCIDQNIRHVAFDPYCAEWLIGMLARQGIETYVVKQGVAAMSEPSKYLEAAVSEGIFQHGGNPISDWQAENVEVKRDENDNIRPVKPQHGSNKRIDGIIAAVMAICVATLLDTGTGGAYSSGSIML